MSQLDVERVNRIISMLFEEMKLLSDDERDLPIVWNVMHMYSSSQLAKLIALRRGMDVELAAIAGGIHDIAVIVTKKTNGHAKKSEIYVRELINKYNNKWREDLEIVTKEEENLLVNAIINHSDKETYSEDKFIELLKDVDSLDRYLHGVKTEGEYLIRCNRVLKELGIKQLNN